LLYKPRTQQEIDQIIQRTADAIEKRELEEVAIPFFETIRPVALVAGKLGGAALAFMIPFFGYAIDDYMVAFQEPQNIEKLLKIIEERRVARKEREK